MNKILIIEDEKTLRETLSELLTLSGYFIIEAKNGLEGLKKMKNENPNLIICDVMMPKLDGYGFLEQHKKTTNSHIPVIMLSAKVQLEEEKIAFDLGAKAYIKKPFEFQALKDCIKMHIRPSL